MTTRLFLLASSVFVALILLSIPDITRGRKLFGVDLTAEAQQGVVARRALGSCRIGVLLISVIVVGLCLVLPIESLQKAQPFLYIPMALTAVIAFNWEHWKLKPLEQLDPERDKRAVVLSEAPDRKGWIALAGTVPLLLLTLSAGSLQIFWERIPESVPVHYGVNGPDRWLERSTLVVYAPVLIGVEICVWLLLVAVLAWNGMRRSRGRWLFVGLMLWLEYLLGSLFTLVSLSPLIPSGFPAVVPALGIIMWFSIGIIAVRRLQLIDDRVESTPDQCWKGGLLYFNRNDPALLVEVREGNNFMFNFANPVSWGVVIGTASLATLVALQMKLFFR